MTKPSLRFVPLVELLGDRIVPSADMIFMPEPLPMSVATLVQSPWLGAEHPQPQWSPPLAEVKKSIDFGFARTVKSTGRAPLWHNLYLEAKLISDPNVPLLTPEEIAFWLEFGLFRFKF